MKLIVAFFFSLIAVVASAQTNAFDVHVSSIAILRAKPIQHEIGITEAQRKRMNVYADKYSADMRAYDAELRKEKSNKIDRQRVARYERELKAGVLAQMSPAQVKRLRELSLQLEQVVALTDPVVAEYIGASKAQITLIQKTYRTGATEIQRIGGQAQEAVLAKYRGIHPKTKEEGAQLQKQFQQEMATAQRQIGPQLKSLADRDTAQIMAILTPKQKAAWKKLQGPIFTFKK